MPKLNEMGLGLKRFQKYDKMHNDFKAFKDFFFNLYLMTEVIVHIYNEDRNNMLIGWLKIDGKKPDELWFKNNDIHIHGVSGGYTFYNSIEDMLKSLFNHKIASPNINRLDLSTVNDLTDSMYLTLYNLDDFELEALCKEGFVRFKNSDDDFGEGARISFIDLYNNIESINELMYGDEK